MARPRPGCRRCSIGAWQPIGRESLRLDLEELDALFHDPSNRRWGVFYYCPEDPRVLAPSRPTVHGYQINFAHPRARRTLALYLAVLILPAAATVAFGPVDAGSLLTAALVVFGLSVGALLGLSAYLARRIDG